MWHGGADHSLLCPFPPADGSTEAPPGRRLYTAARPPEGYVPAPTLQEPLGSSGSESTCSSEEDAGGKKAGFGSVRSSHRVHT